MEPSIDWLNRIDFGGQPKSNNFQTYYPQVRYNFTQFDYIIIRYINVAINYVHLYINVL